MSEDKKNIIIYNTPDGKASVSLYAKDGSIWMNQNQLAELFDTSKQNIGQHISKILEDKELDKDSVVKNYFTTAEDTQDYSLNAGRYVGGVIEDDNITEEEFRGLVINYSTSLKKLDISSENLKNKIYNNLEILFNGLV